MAVLLSQPSGSTSSCKEEGEGEEGGGETMGTVEAVDVAESIEGLVGVGFEAEEGALSREKLRGGGRRRGMATE